MIRLLFAATVFTSAFLLFLVQPMVSKHIPVSYTHLTLPTSDLV